MSVTARWIGFLCAMAPLSVHAETVSVSSADCRKLVRHVPSADATYQPGVDVRGKKVAPADVGGGYSMQMPEQIDIQIGIDLADRIGRRDARRPGAPTSAEPTRKVLPYEGKAPLGTLSIKDNEAYWNGERLAPQDEKLLAEACSKAMGAAGAAKPEE